MKNLDKSQPIDARRALVLDVKGYIRSLHSHPERRIPRSFVYRYVEADDSTYSIWQSDSNDTIPHLFKLLRIAARTQTQAQLFEILGRHASMEEVEDTAERSAADLHLLADFGGASGRLVAELSGDLGDEETPGVISSDEALRMLPAVIQAHEAAERTLNRILALAGKERPHG